MRALLAGTQMSVYDLLKQHVQSRGTPAADVASADVGLAWEEFVTDYAAVAAYINF